MMRVTFLDHSGFFIELDSVCLLFDWWRGELPSLPGKPLIVFASHAHDDHFSPAIFSLPAAAFVLGADIDRAGTPENCLSVGGGETVSPLAGVTVETLSSTDEGVAFLVTAENKTIFHAGDLNWWHWAGEPDPWNPDMEKMFRAYTAPLAGRAIDLALLPLDPRLEEDGFRGPKHFLETADIRRWIPMHQWGKFAFTDRFLACYPVFAAKAVPVLRKGQIFEF